LVVPAAEKENISMKALNAIALVLVIVGGLNWGLVGLFDLNLVSAIFGEDTVLTNLVYILVGLAAIYAIVLLKPVTSDSAMSPRTHRV
jgi:uncharacterized membrane protein YuzA (DUF378 family)